MAAFINLEDSPMFHKQLSFLEDTADELRDRCQKLYTGGRKFTDALAVAYNGDTAFADSLEELGGGQDDPVSVSIGGPVIVKFINAFRELASYKELLRSQVEHMLTDRLMQFLTVDLQNAKDSRRRFEKSVQAYDQAREKVVSLKKNTRDDIVAGLEEELQNSKSAFERSRFNLVSALSNVEARKKYEFLESISAIMDAHLRYFKLGYDLLSQIEPYIHQVLTYAQQSKETANAEQDKLAKRIQEYRTQAELDNSAEMVPSTSVGTISFGGLSSYKSIEAIMQSSNGEVKTIKQGYLLSRSSSLRGNWKRRFFVLDSQGSLYYYRNEGTKIGGSHHHYSGSADQNASVFSRFRARHSRSSSFGEDNLGCRTIDLQTAAIKADAEDNNLRLCFRILSPIKTYTLQAETESDRTDWMNKIAGVIASLLNFLQQPSPRIKRLESVKSLNSPSSEDGIAIKRESVSTILRKIPGNDLCAECTTPNPDWASLNLGILLCIGCSGVHRNLGVHISKVRSITLDVKVWEPTILDLFGELGNAYCNSVWEGSLNEDDRVIEPNADTSIRKPCPDDSISYKELYINAKYVDKSLVLFEENTSGVPSYYRRIWQAVKTQNVREVYRIIVISKTSIVNTTFNNVVDVELYHHADDAQDTQQKCPKRKNNDPALCQRIKKANDPRNCLQGCSLLHLACHCGSAVMIELLIQFGADINMQDFHGRTPLHHCIATGNDVFAKHLLSRGARASISDGGGLSALERAMDMGAITDEKLFLALSES